MNCNTVQWGSVGLGVTGPAFMGDVAFYIFYFSEHLRKCCLSAESHPFLVGNVYTMTGHESGLGRRYLGECISGTKR